jgi:hypothetical protein
MEDGRSASIFQEAVSGAERRQTVPISPEFVLHTQLTPFCCFIGLQALVKKKQQQFSFSPPQSLFFWSLVSFSAVAI